jgi:hypothetical protein
MLYKLMGNDLEAHLLPSLLLLRLSFLLRADGADFDFVELGVEAAVEDKYI